MEYILEPLLWYIAFVFSVTCHEAAHAWAAKLGGDLTAFHGGQVSLDPVPHMRREPFGMIILPILATILYGWPIGYASTPYNPDWARRFPRRSAWMSLAGPAANLALVLLAALAVRAGMAAGFFQHPGRVTALSAITSGSGSLFLENAASGVSILFSMNLLLLVFNLIPIPPLDGSGALPLVLSPALAAKYESIANSQLMRWFGIVIAWLVLDVVFIPVMILALRLLYFGSPAPL